MVHTPRYGPTLYIFISLYGKNDYSNYEKPTELGLAYFRTSHVHPSLIWSFKYVLSRHAHPHRWGHLSFSHELSDLAALGPHPFVPRSKPFCCQSGFLYSILSHSIPLYHIAESHEISPHFMVDLAFPLFLLKHAQHILAPSSGFGKCTVFREFWTSK